jgi:hypothetical protein
MKSEPKGPLFFAPIKKTIAFIVVLEKNAYICIEILE